MIIGVVGFIGSGKSTFSDYLLEHRNFKRVAFADPLKDAASVIFGWDRKALEGDTKESREWREKPDAWWTDRFGYEVTPRYMLQKLGTEAGRDVFHKDLWVHAAAKRMSNPRFDYVVPDVRFPNEVKFVQALGGKVVRVKRGPDPAWYETAVKANQEDPGAFQAPYREKMQALGIHLSEWAWVGSVFDYVAVNDGSVLDLQERAENIYSDIRLQTPRVA